MSLRSQLFRGDDKLEAAVVSDPSHIVPGAAGAHVAKIQAALIRIDGAAIDPGELQSARYGPSTAGAVLTYKKQRDIINRTYQTQADNIVGKMTIAALDREMLAKESEQPPAGARSLVIGMSGEDVRNLQGLLNFHLQDMGVRRLPTDGIFDLKTHAAVLRFQQLAYLPANGIVDENARKALINVGSVVGCLALDYRDRDRAAVRSGASIFAPTHGRCRFL